jgi:hypothetical protein
MKGNHDDLVETDGHQLDRLASRHWPRLRRTRTLKTRLLGLVVLGLVVQAAGCGGGAKPPVGAPGPAALAQLDSYAKCMRSHGIHDFPDPNSQGNFEINAGPGSDLNQNNPLFQSAQRACQTLLPGGPEVPPAASAQQIAAEVKWARCMRSHGLRDFPDPNSRGAFDSSKFNESTPAFRTASKSCESVQPTGSVSAVPGRGSR